MQNSLKALETAYKNFFADLKKPKAKRRFGFPQFKKKHSSKQAYKTNFTNGNIQVRDNYLKLPKCGWIKFHKSQELTGKIISVTICRTKTGKYTASVLCETEIDKYPQVNQNIGLDLGIKSYLVTSTGEIVDNPKYGGVKNGYANWKHYMNAFGYGDRLGVDLPSENKGNIPDTSVYNRVYRNSWNSCTNVTLGIGQDMMLVTPLQIANSMSIVANKGYYYTPHFVRDIDGETEADTILNNFRKKHEVLTHISDTAYETVISGMHDVTLVGTAKYIPKIPGIDICAKTGTAENYRVLNGVRTKLKDHSIFACFAPRDNPKIAIAVIVENGGFGSTWAGPIAFLMIEKYLTDSLRVDRLKEVERIAGTNLMPGWLPREQYKADSTRAQFYFKLTKDSSYLKKFFKKGIPQEKQDTSAPKPRPKPLVVYKQTGVEATEPKDTLTLKKKST